VSFISLLRKSPSLDELLFRLRCTTTNLACMKRFLSVPLWLMNGNDFIEKRHSARVTYSLSTICLLQLKCNTRNATLACRCLVMPGATAWLDAPLPNSSIEKWCMVSLLLDICCLWRHSMTSYSLLQTNVLAKFVDTTWIFRDARAVVGQGEQHNSWGQWKLAKNKTKTLPNMFVSVRHQCWPQKNNKIYRKSFWIFWVPE